MSNYVPLIYVVLITFPLLNPDDVLEKGRGLPCYQLHEMSLHTVLYALQLFTYLFIFLNNIVNVCNLDTMPWRVQHPSGSKSIGLLMYILMLPLYYER